jgi:hypothetical protein
MANGYYAPYSDRSRVWIGRPVNLTKALCAYNGNGPGFPLGSQPGPFEMRIV